jgi:hypothetical protein
MPSVAALTITQESRAYAARVKHRFRLLVERAAARTINDAAQNQH